MLKQNKGFTLMEVVVVLTVIAILGAVIIPGVMGYTDKARLRSDIQSARIVQNAIDLFKAETGKEISTVSGIGTDAKKIIDYLHANEYLNGSLELQTDGAVWNYTSANNKMRVNISECADSVKKVILSENEKLYIINTKPITG